MKNVLAIIGSGRKLGNCETMVKEISRQISVPHQLQLLRLPEYDIQYCKACYRCLFKDGSCVIRDDLDQVLDAMEQADALIVAMPTYFLGAHASLKGFLDRGLCFYARAEKLWGKPAVGLGIAGIEGKEGSTLLDIERLFATLMVDNKGSRIVYGALPGETLLDEANRAVAAELAAALFGEPVVGDGPCCPVCGGQTFRFLSAEKVRCMLCSEAGRLTAEEGRFQLDIATGDHDFLTSEAAALKHRDWLRGMVGRFKEMKGPLREVTSQYVEGGQWIRPAGKEEGQEKS